ncbi:MAG: glycosyl hydrolase family 65 protein [Candidatus Omnitrophota bacterium]
MKDFYFKSVDSSWFIKEDGWYRSLQGVRETQLALGNGFLGSRAVLEEMPQDAKPGTYISGLYDKVGSHVADMVNLPNPFNFKIMTEGEKLGAVTMDIVEHARVLNMRHGLLSRHSVFRDTKKRTYDYQSVRFLSMHDKNVGVMQIIFTPKDAPAHISIETGIDTSVFNDGTVTEGRKKHFRIKALGQFKNEGYLITETYSRSHTIIFRSGFYYEIGGKKTIAKNNIFELKLKKNQAVVFTKVFHIDAVSSSEDMDRHQEISEQNFRKAFNSGFGKLIDKNAAAWEKVWNAAEVSISGDPETDRNFKFNLYHMLICAPGDNGISSVGAKALTGEGYHGHIFWDAEIFLFPFYLYTMPEAAKNMLLYRYRRLDQARAIAKNMGFKGAMFPWESAGSGEEETPAWAKDLDGKIIRIHTGKMEHHITADIAHAFYYYYNVTRDEKFFQDCGYEVIFETARFWQSRVEYSRKKKRYEIKGVVGPDEFHEDVNNNVFTNIMAKWNLLIACRLFHKIKREKKGAHKRLVKKLGLTLKEVADWKNTASRIFMNVNTKKVIEQFDGYFKRKRVKITQWDENSMPVVSKKISPRNYCKTQLVKQADVVMLMYLLPDSFNPEVKKRNYEYYTDRTIHKSSLSLPMYALMAVEVGDRGRAYQLFNLSLNTDIANIHNNTDSGIHAACLGGTWQVLVNGFCGVRVRDEELSVAPNLPARWKKVTFPICWRGASLNFEVTNNSVLTRFAQTGRRKKIKLKVFGVTHTIAANRMYKFTRKGLAKKTPSYYL